MKNRRIYRVLCLILTGCLLLAVPDISYGSEEASDMMGVPAQSEAKSDVDTDAVSGETEQKTEQPPVVQDVQVETEAQTGAGSVTVEPQEPFPVIPNEIEAQDNQEGQTVGDYYAETIPDIQEEVNIFPQIDMHAAREDHSDAYASYSSNIIAGKDIYLSELSLVYGLEFGEKFGGVMQAIEEKYKCFLDAPENFLAENWQDVLAVYVMKQGPAAEGDLLVLNEQCEGELEKLFFMMNLRSTSAMLRKLEMLRVDSQNEAAADQGDDTAVDHEDAAQGQESFSVGTEQFSTDDLSEGEQPMSEYGAVSRNRAAASAGETVESTEDFETEKEYYPLTVEDYMILYDIEDADREILEKYTSNECSRLCAIVTASKGFVRSSVGKNVSEERVSIVAAACSLIGKVGYFWGGKSYATGWDARWGNAMTVTASGSKSTGTVRPYGLDCSGFVAWAYFNGLAGRDAGIGNHTADQWNATRMVDSHLAKPGDLVFYLPGSAGDNNHVGIVISVNADGSLIVVHCSSGQNGVVTGEAWSSGFQYVRTPINLK